MCMYPTLYIHLTYILPPPTLLALRIVILLSRSVQWCLVMIHKVKPKCVCMAYRMICSLQPQFPFQWIPGTLSNSEQHWICAFSKAHHALLCLAFLCFPLCLEPPPLPTYPSRLNSEVAFLVKLFWSPSEELILLVFCSCCSGHESQF